MAVGVALVAWREQLAGIFAVLGLIALGLVLNFALGDWDEAIRIWMFHGVRPGTRSRCFSRQAFFPGLTGSSCWTARGPYC